MSSDFAKNFFKAHQEIISGQALIEQLILEYCGIKNDKLIISVDQKLQTIIVEHTVSLQFSKDSIDKILSVFLNLGIMRILFRWFNFHDMHEENTSYYYDGNVWNVSKNKVI